jgi:hypothetical protein
LEKTLEADISILLKTGHFYFALTGEVLGEKSRQNAAEAEGAPWKA